MIPILLALVLPLHPGGPVAFPAPGSPEMELVHLSDGTQDEVDLERTRRQAREDLVTGLLELADWCTKKKIFLQRKTVYEDILHFDPMNSVAKRGLGFIKDKEGNWIEKERRVPLRNFDRGAVRKFPARRAEITQGYRDKFLSLLDSREVRLSAEQREEILDDLLVVDPDDPRVHALRGEVQLEDRWVLHETAQAKKNRAELKKVVREAFGSATPASVVDANAKERAFGIEWTAVYASPVARSLGTGSGGEIRRLPDAMHAARVLFQEVLAIEAKYPDDFTVYTFAQTGPVTQFLNEHPAIGDSYRSFLAQLDGSLIQGSGDTAHWADEEHRRLDGHVRQAISWLFAQGCGVSPDDGWIFEGFGLYLTRELVGTRLTWFVKPSEYLVPAHDQALKARLLDTRTNWMSEANKVLQGDKRPRLEFLLGKSVNSLTTEDLLYSYVLAAFLIEARPEVIPSLLRSVGQGTPSQEALAKALGLELPRIDDLVCRWLSERY